MTQADAPPQLRLLRYLPLAAAALAAGHLAWEFSHGGIRSHHLLNRSDLPSISNWWGALLLPLLGFIAAGSLRRRLREGAPRWLIAAPVAGALIIGSALSVAFTTGAESLSFYLFLIVLGAGAVFRTYRAEYLLGFVVGMTFTFGAALPTIVGAVAGSISLIVHHVARPAFGWAVRRSRRGE